jgi:CheY-like chemotaxis protein
MSSSPESSNLSKYFVLFVDDEEKTRKAFSRLFGDEFRILLAGDGAEGFEIFQERSDEIGVIVTDQKMPRQTGVQFLAKVAAENDTIVCILSTAYAELEAAISGVNEGGIYRYVTKPWDVPELEITLRRAMELFVLRAEQATQSASGSLDVSQLLAGERLRTVALTQAVHAQDSLSGCLSAGLSFLGVLGEEGLGEEAEIDWDACHRVQRDFFDDVFRESVDNVASQAALDWSRTAPPSAAIQAAAVGCEGLELEFTGDHSNVWPGPAPLLSELLRPLLVAFSKLTSDLPAGRCRVKGNFNTVDFIFSGFPLKKGLRILSTEPDSVPLLREFLAASLLVHAAGGRLRLPGGDHDGLILRLGFEENPDDSVLGFADLVS